jgi:hypothetical protein
MTMYGSQTILESSQAPPPNNCLRSVHCHYRSLYLIYYCVLHPFQALSFIIHQAVSKSEDPERGSRIGRRIIRSIMLR